MDLEKTRSKKPLQVFVFCDFNKQNTLIRFTFMWTNTLYIQSVELGEVEQKVASPQGAFHLHLKPHHYRGRGTNREVRRETDLHLDFFYTKRKVEDSYPLKKDSLEPSAATGENGAS